MRARLNQDSEGLENWNEGRAGSALIYQGAFFAMEVIRVLESGDPNLTFAEMTRQAAGPAG